LVSRICSVELSNARQKRERAIIRRDASRSPFRLFEIGERVRAMCFARYGGPDILTLEQIPAPEPKAGEVLVRVAASSINPVDWKIASGALRLIFWLRLPAVPGFDVAGTVVAAGPGVTGFAPGDRVHARMTKIGACAEMVVVRADVLAHVPSEMSLDEAAALPLAGMTALQSLRDFADVPVVQAHQRVLVVGASGGVGHLAVQIAKAMGCTVVGVCSSRNLAFVRSLGADEVIDYTQPDPFQGQAPFDVVIDAVADNPAPYNRLLAPCGRYVAVLPGPRSLGWMLLNPLRRKKCRPMLLKPSAADLEWLDRLYVAGNLRIVIDERFALERLPEAWQRSMQGRTVGKLVITF